MLLQLCLASVVFLPPVPRESVALQATGQKSEERDTVDMLSRFVLQCSYSKEESWNCCPKEVYYKVTEREWYGNVS